jgi:hypothetical protein
MGVEQARGKPCFTEAQVVCPLPHEHCVKPKTGQLLLVAKELVLPTSQSCCVVHSDVLAFLKLQG